MAVAQQGIGRPAVVAGAPAPRGNAQRRAQTLTAAAFLLPNMALTTVFVLVPLVLAVVISFQKLGSIGGAQYLGVNNFLDLFVDPVFWNSMLNTAIFTVATVPVGMALGLGVAALLNGVLPGRAIYRSIIFLPLVISGVSTGALGQWMFDQYNGFVNKLLAAIGLIGPAWQSSGGWAMTSIILVTLWQRIGFDMLIYLAGLQGVDPQLTEAAMIDGASAWQRFRLVVFPLLGPSTFFLLIMNVIYSFQVFDTVWAMTRGGPGFSTTTVVTYAYRVAFDDHGPQQLGYGAAVGVILFVLTLGITAAQWRWGRNQNEATS